MAAQFAFGMGCEQLRMVLLSAAHFNVSVRLGGCYPAHISYPDLLAAPPAYLPTALHGPVGKVRTFSSGPAEATARAGLLLSTAQIQAQIS